MNNGIKKTKGKTKKKQRNNSIYGFLNEKIKKRF